MNNNYGMNGGYPQVDGNATNFGVPGMPTGNPTIDLLNQSNGIMPNSGNPVPANTGNPTLDLLNQSQVQNMADSSYSYIPNNDMNSANMDAFNQNPVPSATFGQDNMGMNNGMMNYGGVPQQPLDGMGQASGMAMPQTGQFGVESYAQPMPQPQVDYTGQLVQQPLTSMEMAPVPEPTPVLEPTPEPPTNPYGFVSMMPEPTPEPAPSMEVAPTPQPVPSVNPELIPPMPSMEMTPMPSVEPAPQPSGEFNFSFIPLREEPTKVEPQPAMEVPQQGMPMNNGDMGVMQPSGMQTMMPTGMENFAQPAPMPSVNPEPIPPMPGMNPTVPQPMDYNQPYPQPNMGTTMANTPQPYGVDPMMQNMNNGMMQPQPMYPEQPVPQQVPYNNQMPGYPQVPPAQNPNAIFPGIPDDFGNQ